MKIPQTAVYGFRSLFCQPTAGHVEAIKKHFAEFVARLVRGKTRTFLDTLKQTLSDLINLPVARKNIDSSGGRRMPDYHMRSRNGYF